MSTFPRLLLSFALGLLLGVFAYAFAVSKSLKSGENCKSRVEYFDKSIRELSAMRFLGCKMLFKPTSSEYNVCSKNLKDTLKLWRASKTQKLSENYTTEDLLKPVLSNSNSENGRN